MMNPVFAGIRFLCLSFLLSDSDLISLTVFFSWVLKYCQARVRSPKVQSPKVKTKRTWADSIITWATNPTPPPPQWLKMTPLTHPAKKIDQVDSEIKDVG